MIFVANFSAGAAMLLRNYVVSGCKNLRSYSKILQTNKGSIDWVYANGENDYDDIKIEAKLSSLSGGSVDLTTDDDKGIALLRINNPSKKNAFSDLRNAAVKLSGWKEGKALVLYGAEHYFCSGADLATVRAFSSTEDGKCMCMYMQNTLTLLQRLPLLSVAFVEGKAVGGGAELTTACDFRLMNEDADIQFVHKKMGLIPGWGGVTRLVRLVGREKALLLLASAEKINANTALHMGLVDHIVTLTQSEIFKEIQATASNANADEIFPHNFSVHTATNWLQKTFDLDNTDLNVLRAIKSSVSRCSDFSDHTESLKYEQDVFKGLWMGKANLNALSKSRHGKV